MATYCKCFYCGERYDREKIPTIKVNARRYAHEKCYEKAQDGEIIKTTTTKKKTAVMQKNERTLILDKCREIFGGKANYVLIQKQIKDFISQGMTISGILGTLIYFYDVKRNSPESGHGGIGIVPYAYHEASDYYSRLNAAINANKGKNIQEIISKVTEIEITPPRVKNVKIKLFNMEEDN